MQDPPLSSSGALRGFATGEAHVCAIVREDGCATAACVSARPTEIRCWGKNDKGQLGLGDVQPRGDQPNEMGDGLPMVQIRTAAP